jgi:hypothetical protein
VVWALYRPLAQIVTTLITEFRHIGARRAQFSAASAFSLAVIVLIVAAIISSRDWPHDAKLVPLTACGMALVAAVLNLVYELFGPPQEAVAHADAGVKVAAHVSDLGVTDNVVRKRAATFFVWLAGFIGLIALIGFIPAIAVFVFVYMSFGFGEPKRNALAYALGTTLLCWVVFQWGLQVAWPQSLLGDMFPALREATGLI